MRMGVIVYAVQRAFRQASTARLPTLRFAAFNQSSRMAAFPLYLMVGLDTNLSSVEEELISLRPVWGCWRP